MSCFSSPSVHALLGTSRRSSSSSSTASGRSKAPPLDHRWRLSSPLARSQVVLPCVRRRLRRPRLARAEQAERRGRPAREGAEIQPRYSRDTAELQPRHSGRLEKVRTATPSSSPPLGQVLALVVGYRNYLMFHVMGAHPDTCQRALTPLPLAPRPSPLAPRPSPLAARPSSRRRKVAAPHAYPLALLELAPGAATAPRRPVAAPSRRLAPLPSRVCTAYRCRRQRGEAPARGAGAQPCDAREARQGEEDHHWPDLQKRALKFTAAALAGGSRTRPSFARMYFSIL